MNRIVTLLVLPLTLVSSAFAWDRAVDLKNPVKSAKRADIGEVVGIDSSGNVIAAGGAGKGKYNSLYIAKYDRASGNQVWTSRLFGNKGFDRVDSIAVGSDGSVYAATAIAKNTFISHFTVYKLNGSNGKKQWIYRDTTGASQARAEIVKLDKQGFVVACGSIDSGDGIFSTVGACVKLNPETGAKVWTARIANNQSELPVGKLRDVIFDANNDLFAVGSFDNGETQNDIVVAKLNGTNGEKIWQQSLDGVSPQAGFYDDTGKNVLVDNSGDVYITGELSNLSSESIDLDWVVAKYDGSDGAQIWKREFAGRGGASDYVHDAVFDHSGKLILTGEFKATDSYSDLFITKLEPSDGTTIWESAIHGANDASSNNQGLAVVVDENDDVYVGGFLIVPGVDNFSFLGKFAGSDGSELWRRIDRGSTQYSTSIDSLAIDSSNRIAYVGTLSQKGKRDFDIAVGSVERADGQSTFLVRGSKLSFSEGTSSPVSRSLKMNIKDPLLYAPGSLATVDPVTAGMSVELFNLATHETTTLNLPQAGWSSAKRGSLWVHSYSDPAKSLGPCTKASLSEGNLMITCNGSGIEFSLDEASQSALSVRIRLGSAGPTNLYCLRYNGNKKDVAGRFESTQSPQLVVCD